MEKKTYEKPETKVVEIQAVQFIATSTPDFGNALEEGEEFD